MKCAAKQGGQGKTTEGLAWGVSKRAMTSRDGGILLTWGYLSFFLLAENLV